MYEDIRLGDVVRMRKGHPCGSDEWEVVRLGADIGIRCRGCGRRVLLPRTRFTRQVKTLVSRLPAAASEPPAGASPEPPTHA
jgi:hypothetical protein